MIRDPFAPGRALLLDTNLLVVLVVGGLGPREVERFKRTRAYSADDYDLLNRVVGRFTSVLTTPHVLAEASNLLGQLDGQRRVDALTLLAALVPRLDERVVAATVAVATPAYSPRSRTRVWPR